MNGRRRSSGSAEPRLQPRLAAIVVVVALLGGGPPVALTAQSALAALPASTRSTGLGGAGAALMGDAGSLFANPAAIATVHRLALEAGYERYSGTASFGSAALAMRLGRFDWGAGAAALGGGSLGPADLLGVSSLVFRRGVIAIGGSAKYVHQASGPPGGAGGAGGGDAWAGDAGLAIAVFDLMALGVSVQNIGGAFGGAASGGSTHLPRRTRAGFTLNYVDPQGTFRLLTTLEGQWPDTGAAFVVLGVEGGIVARGVGVVARAGYAGRSLATVASPYSFGGSLELGRLHLDYAFRSRGAPVGDMHRFGLRWTP